MRELRMVSPRPASAIWFNGRLYEASGFQVTDKCKGAVG